MKIYFGEKPQLIPKRDWIGRGKNSVYTTLGSSHHTVEEREENDYYATSPVAIEKAPFLHLLNGKILEPFCGGGHMSEALISKGFEVESSDLIDRGYGTTGINFFDLTNFDGHIVSNPPYKYAKECVIHALEIIPNGNYVAFFLKTTFAEGKGRQALFTKQPPLTVYQSSSRINCAKNGDFDGLRTSGGSAVAYCWWLWQKGFSGDTTLKWFN